MIINKIVQAYFSPTGGTEKLVKTAADTMSQTLNLPVETVDFTQPAGRMKDIVVPADTLLVIGVPVYAGRVPNKLLPFVHEHMKGAKTPVFALVSYGNRSFGDGLSELVMELGGNGFCPLAAGAFVCQHSMVAELGTGRPNENDLQQLRALAADAARRTREISDVSELSEPVVEGNTPPGPYYRPLEADGKPASFLKAKPKTDPDKCIRCGLCAKVCSMGSIDPEDVSSVPGICIKCQACVKHCPKGAKYFDDPSLLSHHEMLRTHYQAPNRNAAYLF